jgi:iron(III) transport system ATP-binding protein
MAVGITLKNLSKAFGDVKAIDGINLTIDPGELFFLLGPSGCGKTTLLRSIAGFQQPDAGQVYIGDKDVTAVPPYERDTGMVFQSYALWPHMNVAENVAFGLEMRKVPASEIKKRVNEALTMVQMTDRSDYKPTQLSGGQQQRVALARALVVRPTCLLLDEPLSNLDAKLRLEMRSEIRRICKSSGLTVAYVTHDQKEALSIADRMVVLNQGKIQQLGAPQQLYRQPSNRFVADFLGESNFIEAEVIAINARQCLAKTEFGNIISSQVPISGLGLHQKVCLSIRPESIHLNSQPPANANLLPGRVLQSMYLGETAQHHVGLMSGRSSAFDLKVLELNPKKFRRDPTQQIQLWFMPDDVTVLGD